MASSGLLPDRGGEVLDGLVLEMSPKGDRQGYAVSEPAAQFGDQRRDRYRVYADSLSLRLGPHDEPEPDIALARATRTFATERPLALAFDLGEKKAKYGGSAIPEYWVVDLQTENRPHVFEPPRERLSR